MPLLLPSRPRLARATPRSPRRRRRRVISVGTLRLNARAKALVRQALDRNRLSYGPLTERFESQFAQLHGCRFGVMSNSGTSALQVALQTLKELHGWRDGDEVIIPAATFVATANVVLHNRLQPVLVDVEPRYYSMDPERLAATITTRTRAIIPVHVFGQPADMGPIRALARRAGAQIIEDSCETMFAAYNGAPVGSLGDIGCFSTYVAHLLVTGVGGLNTTNNPDYAVHLRSLINHGRDAIYLNIDDDRAAGKALRWIVKRRFRFVHVGHSFRATEMEAALGLGQLPGWRSMIAARRANAQRLTRALRHLDAQLQLPAVRPGSEHAFMMYPIVLRDAPKTALVNFLEARGVETRDMLPLTNQPVYQRLLGWREADYPVARWINRSGFYVGIHQEVTAKDVEYLAALMTQFFAAAPRRRS